MGIFVDAYRRLADSLGILLPPRRALRFSAPFALSDSESTLTEGAGQRGSVTGYTLVTLPKATALQDGYLAASDFAAFSGATMRLAQRDVDAESTTGRMALLFVAATAQTLNAVTLVPQRSFAHDAVNHWTLELGYRRGGVATSLATGTFGASVDVAQGDLVDVSPASPLSVLAGDEVVLGIRVNGSPAAFPPFSLVWR